VKLFDFGLALDVSIATRLTRAQTGTWIYMAPEVLHGLEHDTFKADMWCLGHVLYWMLSAERMFGKCKTKEELMDQNHLNQPANTHLNRNDFILETVADARCFDIMFGLCEPDANLRWKAKKLVTYLAAVLEGSPRDKN
jgi:serine/threonine protein kinase